MRLNRTETLLTGMEYPTTTDEVIESHGEERLELANGSEMLGDVLARIGDETYQSPGEVQDAIFTGVGHQAVGRRFYSDRDPSTLGEYGPTQQSF